MNRHVYSINPVGWRERKRVINGRQRETGYGGSQLYGLEDKQQQKSQKKNADEEKRKAI